MMTDGPPITLDWSLWCARHLEPYRAGWPRGAPLAMIRLFEKAVAMPAVADAAKGDAANLGTALVRFAPVCCFVGKDAMDAIYAETLPSQPEEPS
jgi:hypothetical protein